MDRETSSASAHCSLLLLDVRHAQDVPLSETHARVRQGEDRVVTILHTAPLRINRLHVLVHHRQVQIVTFTIHVRLEGLLVALVLRVLVALLNTERLFLRVVRGQVLDAHVLLTNKLNATINCFLVLILDITVQVALHKVHLRELSRLFVIEQHRLAVRSNLAITNQRTRSLIRLVHPHLKITRVSNLALDIVRALLNRCGHGNGGQGSEKQSNVLLHCSWFFGSNREVTSLVGGMSLLLLLFLCSLRPLPVATESRNYLGLGIRSG